MQPIYLDYNGTTPHDPDVIAAMRPFLETHFGNPSSSHWYGAGPKAAVARARQQVAALLGSTEEEVIFTSGGTESNNHAIKTIAGERYARGTHIITSAIEHPAVLDVCRFMQGHGFSVTVVPVDGDGMVDPADIAAAITDRTIVISIMHANNEVGTIQPIAEIASLARDNDILLHTDAAQSAGKIPTRVDDLGVDLLSLAGHKLYAPKGIGALYIRMGVEAGPFCHGAGQEMGIRAGTENVLEIVGLGKACEIAAEHQPAHTDHMSAMRDRLERGLEDRLAGIRFNGHRTQRLPNTCSVSFSGVEATAVLQAVGDVVAASAGAACHADQIQISHVLEAMGVPIPWARGTIRLTTGRMTTAAEIDRAVDAIATAVEALRK